MFSCSQRAILEVIEIFVQFDCLSLYRNDLYRNDQLPSGRDPFNQNFRNFRSKTQWIGSVQPEKFRKTFPGRTGRNFG